MPPTCTISERGAQNHRVAANVHLDMSSKSLKPERGGPRFRIGGVKTCSSFRRSGDHDGRSNVGKHCRIFSVVQPVHLHQQPVQPAHLHVLTITRELPHGGLYFVCDHRKHRNTKRYTCGCNLFLFLPSLSQKLHPKSHRLANTTSLYHSITRTK